MHKVVRFVINGFLATCVHTLVVFYLVQIRNVDQGSANAVAFLTATSVSYVGHTFWTFEAVHSGSKLLRFIVVACMGSFFSYIIASFCAGLGLEWWMSVVLIVAIVPVFTWLAHNKWTYAR